MISLLEAYYQLSPNINIHVIRYVTNVSQHGTN